jgi:hypothetical protein
MSFLLKNIQLEIFPASTTIQNYETQNQLCMIWPRFTLETNRYQSNHVSLAYACHLCILSYRLGLISHLCHLLHIVILKTYSFRPKNIAIVGLDTKTNALGKLRKCPHPVIPNEWTGLREGFTGECQRTSMCAGAFCNKERVDRRSPCRCMIFFCPTKWMGNILSWLCSQ